MPRAIVIVKLRPVDKCRHFSLSEVKSGPSQSTEAVSPLGSTSAARVPMASEDSTEHLPGDAAGSEVKPDAVESFLLDATEAGVDEANLQNSLMGSQQMEQEGVEKLQEEIVEDLDLSQQTGVDHESGPEEASESDQNKDENCAQGHSEQRNAGKVEKNEERKIAVDPAQYSEELVIAKVEDFTNEMTIAVDQTEDCDGRMEVDGSDDAGWCELFACY